VTDVTSSTDLPRREPVTLKATSIQRMLGIDLAADEVTRIFKAWVLPSRPTQTAVAGCALRPAGALIWAARPTYWRKSRASTVTTTFPLSPSAVRRQWVLWRSRNTAISDQAAAGRSGIQRGHYLQLCEPGASAAHRPGDRAGRT
jgi:hypothetical protein